MSISIYFPFLYPDGTPDHRTFEGIKDLSFINDTLRFKHFDPYISDFRDYVHKDCSKTILYFTVN